MDIFSVVIIALALSADAFAVSIINGMCYINQNKKSVLFTSFLFGLAQTIMPIVGFFAGSTFADAISHVDHWVAFTLLGFIGAKMIVESIREWHEQASVQKEEQPCKKLLFTQSVATSIDALAVGVSFAALGDNIFMPAITIGTITFASCVIAHYIGKKMGTALSKWAQLFGGVVLVLIGTRILLSHLGII